MVSVSNCPKCGAPLNNIPDNVEFVDCQFCTSRIRVRDASEIVKDPQELLFEHQPDLDQERYDHSDLNQENFRSTQTTTAVPWYKSTLFYWVVFLIFPPLWAILAIIEKAMARYLKVIAWLVLALYAFACVTLSWAVYSGAD